MSSDIVVDQLIFRKTPQAWHPYIKLARLDRPIGTWLLLIPCWWAVVLSSGGVMGMNSIAWGAMFKMAAGAMLMRSAGCVVNDIWDRELDASVARTKTRPLASGEMTVFQALIFLAVLLLLSFFILISFSSLAIVLGILALAPVALYPKMKRLTWWPQLFLGFTFNWGALLGWAAITGHLSLASILLYAAGIFWTLGYDTIYACQDKEDDALVGIKSTALLFGDRVYFYVSMFYGLSLLFIFVAKYEQGISLLTPLFLLISAAQLAWQIRHWNKDNAESCLRVFKSNRLYGLLVLLVLAV